MNTTQFLHDLQSRDVRLWVDGDRLCCDAPSGALTPALRDELTQRKAAIVAYLRRLDGVDRGGDGIPTVDRGGVLPLTAAQEGIWMRHQLNPERSAYNVPIVLTFDGALNVARLGESVRAVEQRHESLRTRCRTQADGTPAQVVGDVRSAPFDVVRVDSVDEAARRARDDAARPFHLQDDAPMRACLLRLDAETHWLVITFHHVAVDGVSLQRFVDEVLEHYRARHEGRAPRCAPLPVQPADVAAWQHKRLRDAAMTAHLDYWRGTLDGLAPVDLPADRSRRAGANGAAHRMRLDATRGDALQALARRGGTTPFVVFLAATFVLLRRLTGQSDLAVGVPVAGRDRPEMEALIGCFVNLLVLRVTVGASDAFSTVVRRVQRALTDAHAHRQLPFERLVETLRPNRDASRPPLVQVAVAWQVTDASGEGTPLVSMLHDAVSVGDVAVGLRDSDVVTPKFDLTIQAGGATRQGEGIDLRWEYDANRFDADTVHGWADAFDVLIEDLLASPSTPVSQAAIMPAPVRRRMLDAWNQPAATFPTPTPLHRRFAAQVATRPNAVALASDDGQVSYAALDAYADRVARALRTRGIGAGDVVALSMAPSIDLIAGMLGIWKAGGAYVPIDPAYPARRFDYVLGDTGARVLVTRTADASRLPVPPDVECIAVDALGHASADPSVAGTDETLAYVIYTSGSTGQPKGVMISHASAARLFDACERSFDVGPRDVWSLFHSFAFDFSVWEIWGALASGGRLVVVPPSVRRDPTSFVNLAARERVTFLNQTPSAFGALIAAEREQAADRRPLTSIRYVVFGGEALDPARLRPWHARYDAARTALVNMYGITETTVHVTVRRLSGSEIEGQMPSRVGRALDDLALVVLDDQMQLAPVGTPGELFVAGAGLARGYLGQPARTADRFVPNPFAGDAAVADETPLHRAGSRLYRTGDLVRWRDDGDLEYLGRIDRQVQLRGHRVELGEIEAQLAAVPSVAEAAVVVRTDDRGPRLLAYVVPRDGIEAFDKAAVWTHVRDALPEYMVPSALMTLEGLPLTVNGKLDRKALPEPTTDRSAAHVAFRAPSTPSETVVARLFADVLDADRVGVDDDFFALGGHSLLATRLLTRLRNETGVPIPLRTLFETPSVAAIARALDQRAASVSENAVSENAPDVVSGVISGDGCADELNADELNADELDTDELDTDVTVTPSRAEDESAPIRALAPDAVAPLSFAQQRLWFLHQMEPESPDYNIAAALRLRGPLDAHRLRDSLQSVVDRHAVLRTRFADVDGEPRLHIDAAATVALPCDDLSAVSARARVKAAQRRAAREARRPFDLTTDLPVRARLLRLDAADHVLLVTLHHVASDGRSVQLLTDDVRRAYATGRAAEEGDARLQYADFAAWQRAWWTSERLAEARAYWVQTLGATRDDAFALPTDRPRPPTWQANGDTTSARLPGATVDALQRHAQRHRTTLFAAVLGVFNLLLTRVAAHPAPVVGTPVAGRTHADVQDVIGCFVNTLVLRTDLRGATTFDVLLDRIRETVVGAQAHQALPFEQLVDALQPERDPSRHPLFQVMLSYQTADEAALPSALDPNVSMEPFDVPDGVAKFDLTLVATETSDGMDLTLEYATDLLDASTAQRWLHHFVHLADAVASAPGAPLHAIPLPSAEREVVRRLSAGRTADRAADWALDQMTPPRLVVRRLREQAMQTPDAVAVVDGAACVTLGALVRSAERVREALRRCGCGTEDVITEDVVGVYASRSVAQVAAMFGVWMAGAIYLPLDADAPADRLRDACANADVAVLVTAGADASGLSDVHVPRLAVDTILSQGDPDPQADPDPSAARDPNRAAYLLYTSGSTGRPKGVVVSHRALAHHAASVANAYALTSTDRVLQFAPVGFDVSLEETVPTLLAGGTVVLTASDAIPIDVARLSAWMDRSAVTVANLPGSYFHAWCAHLDAGAHADARPHARAAATPASLRTLVVGSEAVHADRLAAWHAWRPDVALWNAYGLTEATVTSTLWRVDASQGGAEATAPVGRPLGATTVHVLDADLRPSPVGAPGELFVGGPGVARGYRRMPRQTAARFVPDPFSDAPGARLYCTGDRARWQSDGTLHLLGRMDRQVNVRGHRVELGEVEAALRAVDGVDEVAVVAAGDGILAAYLATASAGADSDETATMLLSRVRDAVGRRLPAPMIPSTWTVVDALPRTASGKVDAASLAASATPVDVGVHAPLDGPVETRLGALWTDVLPVDRVGATDDFFDLGGHSLLAMKLVGRVRDAFDVDLTVRDLFETSTVRGLAHRIDAARHAPHRIGPIRPAEDDDLAPDDLLDRIDELSDDEVDALLTSLTSDDDSAT